MSNSKFNYCIASLFLFLLSNTLNAQEAVPYRRESALQDGKIPTVKTEYESKRMERWDIDRQPSLYFTNGIVKPVTPSVKQVLTSVPAKGIEDTQRGTLDTKELFGGNATNEAENAASQNAPSVSPANGFLNAPHAMIQDLGQDNPEDN